MKKKEQKKDTLEKKKKLVDVLTYTKNGIDIDIKVDYRKREISLLDSLSNTEKSFIFANRGIEYMNSWLNILDAMRGAIIFGKSELENYVSEQSEVTQKRVVDLIINVNKLKK